MRGASAHRTRGILCQPRRMDGHGNEGPTPTCRHPRRIDRPALRTFPSLSCCHLSSSMCVSSQRTAAHAPSSIRTTAPPAQSRSTSTDSSRVSFQADDNRRRAKAHALTDMTRFIECPMFNRDMAASAYIADASSRLACGCRQPVAALSWRSRIARHCSVLTWSAHKTIFPPLPTPSYFHPAL